MTQQSLQPQNSHPRQRTRPGFTLVELLVAVGTASLMLLLINIIFQDTSKAVTKGIAVSDIIADTRGASDQFELDADAMLGPSDDPTNTPGGFLIIVNHRIPDVTVRKGEELRDEIVDGVRSDQLVFIRLRDDGTNQLIPITPKQNNTFTNDFLRFSNDTSSGFTGEHVKIWYGHPQLTDVDGTDRGLLKEDGPNKYANDWALGRQAMFLIDQGIVDTTGPTISPDGKWDLVSNSLHIHADFATYDASIKGDTTPPMASGNNDFVYHGLADEAVQVLGFSGADHRGLTSTDPDFDAASPSVIDDLVNGPGGDYQSNAYRYAYLIERLRANNRLLIDPSFAPDPDRYTLASWQIAQMHPIYLNHVSDFIVDFAGDYSPGTSRILAPDGKIDIDNDGNIRWYSFWYNEPPRPFPGHPGNRRNPDFPYNSSQDLPYDDSQATAYAPPAGLPAYDDESDVSNPLVTSGANANANAAFVFRHDAAAAGQTNYWPYLIRIRYRVHDARGIVSSGGQHGMWFEHILKVNREPTAP